MVEYGRMSPVIGIFGLLILCIFLSLFYGIAGIFIKKSLLNGKYIFLIIPSVWITKDLVLEKIFGGFPWCFAGYSQYKNIFFIQIAEIGGIYILSFLIILINLLIFMFLKKRKKKYILALFITLILIYTFGFFLYQKNNSNEKNISRNIAGIIQPNTGQNFSMKKKWRRVTLEELFNDSRELKKMGAEFVIWPEFTLSIYPLQNERELNRIFNFVENNIPIFAGFTDFRSSEEIYNSMILFDKKRRIDKYDKIHLVPYGEYVLFKDLLFFIKKITNEVSEFTPGNSVKNISLNGHKIATPICYELIYPELVREFVKKDGELIIIISNDSWYGTSAAPHQLLSMSIFRSIETRRYILRSTSNGISALIDSNGRILKSVQLMRRKKFIAGFRYRKIKTFYVKAGYMFPYIASLLFLISYIVSRKKRAGIS